MHIYLGDSYPNLKNLEIDTNDLVEVDLSGVTNTGFINLRDNNLTSLDISNCAEGANVQTVGNSYDIEVDPTRTFDISTLPGKFDVTKASNWTGGSVDGNILTVDQGAEKVTYSYDIGKNTTAEFTLNVTAKAFALGDVNEDNAVNILDATLIQKYIVKIIADGEGFNAELADVNQDGTVSIIDATMIQIMISKE